MAAAVGAPAEMPPASDAATRAPSRAMLGSPTRSAFAIAVRAGSTKIGDEAFAEVFHPYAERLLARGDAVLRVGGPSEGADLMVRLARQAGKDVYRSLEEVPSAV